jgi:hypothetical protein
MESLPQELIDKVIDNLPHSSLRSLLACRKTLAAKEPRIRFFAIHRFLVRAETGFVGATNIPQGPRWYSFLRSLQSNSSVIHSWNVNPRYLVAYSRRFTSMTTLWIFDMPPSHSLDDLPNSVSFGEFGKKIERSHAPVSTLYSRDGHGLGSLPPKPGELFSNWGQRRERPPSALPHASQRRSTGGVRPACTWERGRNRPGSVRGHIPQTLHECIGSWAGITSYTFFRGDRGTADSMVRGLWGPSGSRKQY